LSYCERVAYSDVLRAVGELGGTVKLLPLYEQYREVRGELQRLGLLGTGELKPFPPTDAVRHRELTETAFGEAVSELQNVLSAGRNRPPEAKGPERDK
jgi:hypothetical protein